MKYYRFFVGALIAAAISKSPLEARLLEAPPLVRYQENPAKSLGHLFYLDGESYAEKDNAEGARRSFWHSALLFKNSSHDTMDYAMASYKLGEAHIVLGVSLDGDLNFIDAISYLNSAKPLFEGYLSKNPTDQNARELLAMLNFYLARSYFDTGNLEKGVMAAAESLAFENDEGAIRRLVRILRAHPEKIDLITQQIKPELEEKVFTSILKGLGSYPRNP